MGARLLAILRFIVPPWLMASPVSAGADGIHRVGEGAFPFHLLQHQADYNGSFGENQGKEWPTHRAIASKIPNDARNPHGIRVFRRFLGSSLTSYVEAID
ncbi:MAG: hypothetical protein D6795_14205 [Deltaproteobacteria bacterium]|nr:MAG: hypothetical protein D6795_14205 [Deltaproteobacteria bacterium]